MPAHLIAAPSVSFELLDDTLTELDWFLESESQTPPAIPGEPELCIYTHRRRDARITYTFNPITYRRVLAFDGSDAGAERAVVAARISVLGPSAFAQLGDEELRRQVLRWLIHDFRVRSPHIDEAIRNGLADPDEEVRRTAERAAEHFRAPRSPQRPPGDDASLLAHALATPLEPAPWPSRLPVGIAPREDGFVLSRSGAVFCWVGPVAHWLGVDASIRRVTSAGFLFEREPVSCALASWALSATPGPSDALGDRASEPHRCDRDEAERIAAALARIEGAPVRLATADEWEMAARGPDGRVFPWGNFAMADTPECLSPWGAARMVGHGLAWTADGELCGGATCTARTRATLDTRAEVRLVIAEPERG